jgi:predicted porin
MALRHSIGITAAILAVLGAGPALADDPAVPAAEAGPLLLVDGAAEAPADDGSSVWTDLRQFFSDTTFTFGATPLDQDGPADSDVGYNAYARIDLSGFAIGSHFAQWSEPTFFGEENQSFGFGASYTQESWTVGIDWSRGDYNEAFLDVDTGETSDVIAFTSSYDLRPGVQINGLLEYSEQEPAPSGSDDGALTVGIGTLIHF